MTLSWELIFKSIDESSTISAFDILLDICLDMLEQSEAQLIRVDYHRTRSSTLTMEAVDFLDSFLATSI